MIFKVSKELLFFLKEVEKLSVFLLRFKRFFTCCQCRIERDENVLYLAMPNSFHDLIIHNKLHGGICDQFLKLGQTGKYMN